MTTAGDNILVGLVGATGSGKTTLATGLVERHGFVRMHMGQPIKDMLSAIGLTDYELTGPPAVRLQPSAILGGKSPRRAMETLGTDWGRNLISEDIWANAVERKILEAWTQEARPIVIDDLRFPSDWRVIDRLGGLLIRIVRPGVAAPRTSIDRLAHSVPFVRRFCGAMGMRILHETEYHWRDAPAEVTLTNDRAPVDLENSFLEALARRRVVLFPEARPRPQEMS